MAVPRALIGVLLLWLYAEVLAVDQLDFAEVLVFAARDSSRCVTVGRFVRAPRARRALLGAERALLVGGGEMAEAVRAASSHAHPEYGLERDRRSSPSGDEHRPSAPTLPVLGDARRARARRRPATASTRVIVSRAELEEASC